MIALLGLIFILISILLTGVLLYHPSPKINAEEAAFLFRNRTRSSSTAFLDAIARRQKGSTIAEESKQLWVQAGRLQGIFALTRESSLYLEMARLIVEKNPALENDEYEQLCRMIVSLRLALIVVALENLMVRNSRTATRFFGKIWAELYFEMVQRIDHLLDEYASSVNG